MCNIFPLHEHLFVIEQYMDENISSKEQIRNEPRVRSIKWNGSFGTVPRSGSEPLFHKMERYGSIVPRKGSTILSIRRRVKDYKSNIKDPLH